MTRDTMPAKDQPKNAEQRRLRLANVNGMVLVVGALAATILASGLTEARYAKIERQTAATKSAAGSAIRLAQCPMFAADPNKPTVR